MPERASERVPIAIRPGLCVGISSGGDHESIEVHISLFPSHPKIRTLTPLMKGGVRRTGGSTLSSRHHHHIPLPFPPHSDHLLPEMKPHTRTIEYPLEALNDLLSAIRYWENSIIFLDLQSHTVHFKPLADFLRGEFSECILDKIRSADVFR